MNTVSRHISSTKLIRSYNASTVLRVLYEQGSATRSQLTKLTGMSSATITRIISDLIGQGIVLEGRVGKSTGGRRPIYIHIDHSKLYLTSVKLLKDDVAVAVLDLKGEILHLEKIVPNSISPEELLNEVADKLKTLLHNNSINIEHILGLGIAVSGVCNHKKGIVLRSVNLGWENVSITKIISKKLELPIFIENDANASALAEAWLGSAKNATNSMFIKTETGTGAGIILNGSLINGPNFMTGEIGHIPIIQNGHPCRCGQQGCLEPYVYFGDIRARYKEQTGQKINKLQFIKLVNQRDPIAIKFVKEAASVLALSCAHWGMLLDLDVITISGIWGSFKKEIIDYCQMYYKNVLHRTGIARKIRISASDFGDEADLLGAAGLVISHWLSPQTVPLDR